MQTIPYAAAALVGAAMSASALGQTAGYPTRVVRFIVPVAAGGTVDIVARTLAQRMTDALGHQVIVENRPSASSLVGTQVVAKSPPDGYTLLATSTTFLSAPAVVKDPGYDAVKDFAPITLLGSAPYFLSVNRTLQANTLAEFIKLARDKPGGLTYASTGNGSGLHLSMELLKSMAKIDLVHVPYKSAGIAITDLLAGQVQAQFISYGTGVGHFKAGRLRALAATTKQRSKMMPDVPTIAEAGVPGYDSGVWYALLAPRGTPPAVIKRLHDDCAELVKSALGTQMVNDGITPIVSTPAELAAYTKTEIAKWAEVVKRSGATVD